MNETNYTIAPMSFLLGVCQNPDCGKQFPMQMEVRETLEDGSVLVRLPAPPTHCRDCSQKAV